MRGQQQWINQYRRDRDSSNRDARLAAGTKSDAIKRAISWNRQNPQHAQRALTTMAPKAVEAMGNDPLGRY